MDGPACTHAPPRVPASQGDHAEWHEPPRCRPTRRFAQEHHKLALALNGRVETREVPLECAGAVRDTAAAG